jgi:hypothetical protein
VVIGQRELQELKGYASPEKLLLASGSPILVIPSGWKSESIGNKILVGWNASREARRAVADALPNGVPPCTINTHRARRTAPVSQHRKRPHRDALNTIVLQRKCAEINEADLDPAAYSGLVAGSSAVRTNNKINSCSEPVCGRGGLSPQVSGKCLHRQSGLRASPLTPKNSTIKNRGQLLSFLFAVAPNRTMSL